MPMHHTQPVLKSKGGLLIRMSVVGVGLDLSRHASTCFTVTALFTTLLYFAIDSAVAEFFLVTSDILQKMNHLPNAFSIEFLYEFKLVDLASCMHFCVCVYGLGEYSINVQCFFFSV
jgi:hypothetical protein